MLYLEDEDMEEEDKVIDAINSGVINPISFDKIRQIAIHPTPPDVRKELNYGQKPPKTQDHLNRYCYSYEKRIFHQCYPTFKFTKQKNRFDFTSNKIEIIDYGCGQGFASILFFDEYKQARQITSKITLIDPSEIALKRAEHILATYTSKEKINPICKGLDDIKKNEIQTSNDAAKIHLFSNILDIENAFDIKLLFNKIIVHKGKNYFMAISSDRDNHGGNKRLDDFYNCFEKNNSGYEIIRGIKPSKINIENPNLIPEENYNAYFFM